MQIISKAVGIDLGTTNSAVAILDSTDTDIVLHRDPKMKRETTPSCVWKNPKTGEIVVGHLAFRRIGTSPPPVRSIKRSMGQQIKVNLGGERLSPEEVSSYILMEMKRQILEEVKTFNTADTEWIVDRAIVTVPAYFDTDQIEATRNAGELAGLEIVELLHEPTAAACYHCWRTKTYDGTFLVYDFGGGTFDVSVLRSSAGAFEVLGISGNRRLGGDDLDFVIAEELQERLIRDGYSMDLDIVGTEADKLLWDKLQFLAESVKKALSTAGEFLLRDTSLQDKDGEPVIIETMFERDEIEARMRPVIERTMPYCFEALTQAESKAGIRLSDIDAIILAGGSTHVPLVREIVKESLCLKEGVDEPRARCSDPVYDKVDTLVALGAAIRAAATGGMAVYNPEKTVRVSFRGTGSTGSSKAHVGGSVTSLDESLRSQGGRVRLTIAGIDFEDLADLNEQGVFGFKNVPLQPGAENLLTFQILGADGKILATVGRPIAQSREKPNPTGGTMSTAVQSKPLLLEVTKEGKQHYHELIPSLKTLPADEDFDFRHPGDTELIRFSLFSNKRKIKEIRVAVDSSLPRGTPITMNVKVDELAFITVKGKIGDTEFEAAVEPPPPRELPSEEEIRKLQLSFQDGLQYLAKGKRAVAEARYNKAKKSFEAAISRGDSEQALHDYEEMEEVVANISRADGAVEPPKEFFDKLVGECLEINRHAAEVGAQEAKPHDHREMAKAIEAQRQQGEKACLEGNQKRYTDAIMMLENIKNQLIALIQTIKPPPKQSETEQAQSAVSGAGKQADDVKGMAKASGRHDLADEAERIKKELKVLEKEAQKDPTTVREKASRLWGRLQQIKNTLMGKKDDGGEGKPPEL